MNKLSSLLVCPLFSPPKFTFRTVPTIAIEEIGLNSEAVFGLEPPTTIGGFDVNYYYLLIFMYKFNIFIASNER